MTNKKFFTLIHGDSVHLAPEAKIIDADSYSTACNAYELLEKVQNDAELFKAEVLIEAEKYKEQSQKEGFEEGFKQWADHLARLEEEIKKVRKELEKAIIPVALKAAKKIVGREIELSENVIIDIVANSLKVVSTHKKIVIYVNKKDLETLETNKGKLKDLFENLEAFSLRERADIQPGGCVIETEGGIINAQIDNQWRIMENAFEVLIRQKESAH